jgi:hypothetical protein
MPIAGLLPGRITWRLPLVLGCWWLAAIGSTVSAQTPAPLKHAFDIPEDVAEKSLKLFSAQSGRGLIVASDMATAVRTKRVRGQFTAREALNRMLAGTGLIAREDPKNGAFVVHRETSDPNGQRAAQPQPRDRPKAQSRPHSMKFPLKS